MIRYIYARISYIFQRIFSGYEMDRRIKRRVVDYLFPEISRSGLVGSTQDMIHDGHFPNGSNVSTHIWARLDRRLFSIRFQFNLIVYDYVNWERKATKKQLEDAYRCLESQC